MVDGWCPILSQCSSCGKCPYPVSLHQNCKRIGVVQLLVMSIKFICRYSSTWCCKDNPGHGTRIARGWVGYKYYQLLFIRSISEFLNLVPQMILVTAPELQEDWLGTEVISMSLYLYLVSPLVPQDILVMAPELQEVSLYQFI